VNIVFLPPARFYKALHNSRGVKPTLGTVKPLHATGNTIGNKCYNNNMGKGPPNDSVVLVLCCVFYSGQRKLIVDMLRGHTENVVRILDLLRVCRRGLG